MSRLQKAMVDIGGDVWVDVESVLIVQPRTVDGDGVRKLPGCVVILRGDAEPVYGAAQPAEVVQRLARAGLS